MLEDLPVFFSMDEMLLFDVVRWRPARTVPRPVMTGREPSDAQLNGEIVARAESTTGD